MRAVVLVGGFGTRLRPLTLDVPKPMLPVGHRPMIARLVDRLARGGVTDVVLALGFRPEPFIEAFPDNTCGDVRLSYAVEPEPLDTAGAIRFAADEAGIDDTFVVANGDVMTDLDVGALVAAHRRFGADATLHLIGVDDPSAFGVVDLADDGRVLAFVEKPAPGTEPSNLINAGTYVFEPGVLDLIEPGHRVSVERDTFQRLVASGTVFGVATDDYWIDAGRPELYLAANLDLLGGARRFDHCEPIAATANVAGEAVITNSVVGEHVTVAAGASVSNSVLLPHAVVEAQAVVERSLVMGVVGERAVITATMVGASGVVAADAVLTAASVPAES
ncbi:MAG TPA: NDP-sugar synthase [Ilumatobacteraceae bacterium]|nr:NDP-sugar synthase [Ilumatobacteraceae bacterium]